MSDFSGVGIVLSGLGYCEKVDFGYMDNNLLYRVMRSSRKRTRDFWIRA